MGMIENVSGVLELLTEQSPEVRARDVAAKLGVHRSNASRMLSQMTKAGILEKLPNGSYSAGYRSRALGQLFLARHPLLEYAEQAIAELVARFPYAGFVAKLHGDQHVLLAVTRGAHSFHMLGRVNEARPAVDTAGGRAMLSRMSDADVLGLVGDAPEAELDELLGTLQTARRRQFLYKPSTRLQGVTAVASAVPQPNGHGDLCICLCWPDDAIDSRLKAKMADHVLRQAEVLGALG